VSHEPQLRDGVKYTDAWEKPEPQLLPRAGLQ